jgi:DNA-binding LytR/AlgR family response regulator
MIRCIAIDDEPLALKQIGAYIEKTPFLKLVASCDSAFRALEVLEKEPADLLFVDIHMPDLSGMDFVKSLDLPIQVVFTTAHSHYAVEGFRVDALDYLLKPIDYKSFLKAANKARTWFELHAQQPVRVSRKENFLFIKSAYKLVRVRIDDIKYIEGKGEYVRIHLANDKPQMSLLSMKSVEDQLPPDQFMRVHRSFIVNLNMITTIERNRIVFDGTVYIPVSEQYKARFQEFVARNFMG